MASLGVARSWRDAAAQGVCGVDSDVASGRWFGSESHVSTTGWVFIAGCLCTSGINDAEARFEAVGYAATGLDRYGLVRERSSGCGTTFGRGGEMPMAERQHPLMIGATAADPKRAVYIWNAIRKYFNEADLKMEYALYSTYDALCAAVLDGHVDIAWNAPMAHAQLLLQSPGACRTLAMRDSDEDVHSLIVARADAAIVDLDDLRGRRLALGVGISSELYLLPVSQLAEDGFDIASDCELVELETTEYSNLQRWVDDRAIFGAMMDGRADAGVIFEPWMGYLLRRYELAADDIVEVWRTRPYCHCAYTSGPSLGDADAERFVELLVAMDPEEPEIAEMMRMEHLTRWVRATDDGWSDLMGAVRNAGLVGKIF